MTSQRTPFSSKQQPLSAKQGDAIQQNTIQKHQKMETMEKESPFQEASLSKSLEQFEEAHQLNDHQTLPNQNKNFFSVTKVPQLTQENQKNQINSFSFPIHEHFTQNNQQSIDIENFSRVSEFRVVIHEVNSSQSLPEGKVEHLIQFSKSQLQIPIDVDSQQSKCEQTQQQYVNVWKKNPFQDQDLYLDLLNQKQFGQSKQNDSSLVLKSIEPNKFDKMITKIASNVTKHLQDNTLSKQHSQETNKKSIFKIKKIKDDRNFLDTPNLQNNKILRELRKNSFNNNLPSIVSNESRNISLKASPRYKKHVSNFESLKSSPDQSKQNIHYQVATEAEKMSRIFQGRFYSSQLFKGGDKKQNRQKLAKLRQKNILEEKNCLDESSSKIRKIIKRSPYGLLQIEVKDKRNEAKITNLRILKPKEMLKLKKLPNITKPKDNTFQ